MQLEAKDYELLQNRLAFTGAMLTWALALVDGSPYQSQQAAERDEAWYQSQRGLHPSSTPHDPRNLRPLLVALFRQIMWQESPSRLEAEIDAARDGGLPGALSLCALRDRITKHLQDQAQAASRNEGGR